MSVRAESAHVSLDGRGRSHALAEALFRFRELGIVLALVEKYAPKRIKTYVPSPYGLGLAMVLGGSNCIMMFIGAALAELYRRRQQESVVTPVASGLSAGESLMGVIIIIGTAVGWIPK